MKFNATGSVAQILALIVDTKVRNTKQPREPTYSQFHSIVEWHRA